MVFCSQNIGEYSIHQCHTPPGATGTEHTCQALCFSRYPLQTDSTICSVMVLLMAGLAFADKSYFYELLCNEKSPTASELSAFQHLSVLIAWFAEGKINSCYLIPPIFLTDGESTRKYQNISYLISRFFSFSTPFASCKQVHIAKIMIQL